MKTDIDSLSPEETLEVLSYIMNEKVKVLSRFEPEDSAVVTHQSLVCICGDFVTMTEPQPLDVPLTPVAIVGHLHKNEIN